MSFQFRQGHRVFVYREYVDMRSGFNKLSMFVREKMKCNILQGDLYLFLGKNRRRIKGLCYDGTGLVMIAKRMEHGKLMKLENLETSEITVDELHLLLDGSVIARKKFDEAALTNTSLSKTINCSETDSTRAKHRNRETVGVNVGRESSRTLLPSQETRLTTQKARPSLA